MIKLRWVIAGIGAVIAIAGLLYLSSPVSAIDKGGHSVSCGTATKPLTGPSVLPTCASAVKARLHVTIPVTFVGMIILITGVFTQIQKNTEERAKSEQAADPPTE